MSEGIGYLPEHVVDILVEVCLGGGEHGVDVHAAAARQLQQPRTVSFNIINVVPSTSKQALAESGILSLTLTHPVLNCSDPCVTWILSTNYVPKLSVTQTG